MLQNKRILLVAPKFFGYANDIVNEMVRCGASVDWLPDRPFDSTIAKALTRVRPDWVQPFASGLYKKMLESFGARHYDYIFVINGQTLSQSMLRRLRIDFPTAKFILYMWDSMENRPGVLKNLKYFDSALSFDPQSSRQFGMKLRPLYYSHDFKPLNDNVRFDLSFIGTMHSDRYAVINKIKQGISADIRSYFYLYLQSPMVYQYYRATKRDMRHAQKSEFSFAPLDRLAVKSVFGQSNCIIDVEHPEQRGATMRTFEALGAEKKLITTNKNVSNLDIYATGNVCIINRERPVISKNFIKSPFIPYSKEIMYRYSLNGWLEEILKFNS
ncbi:hypothetical protein [Polynucleobacter sp. Tro8-14-1]|uniref:hypothetical protein n=1 Tax=Polynucleobacter sp. Tro8-14-1 TaxID=1758383 RepID=UPI001C0C0EAE|nr:hypothetical protein [Polynucleobacter sp. Tro8-14-1]MBU3563628.1 hypothetical protein [Polynucleobacter sp. Tro8-14-1]